MAAFIAQEFGTMEERESPIWRYFIALWLRGRTYTFRACFNMQYKIIKI
jgi:hypothetical protein